MSSRLRTVMATSVAVLALSASIPVCTPAFAQTATPEQAAALKAQITSWLAGMGPTIATGPGPIQVSPAGDHLDVSVPMRLTGAAHGDLQLNGSARPHDGMWSITAIKNTLPMKFTIEMPVPKAPGDTGPARTTQVAYTVNAQAQDGQAEYDPSFAKASSWSNSLAGVTILAEGSGISQASSIADMHGTGSLTPNGTDRADFASEANATGYTLVNKPGPDLPGFTATIGGIHLVAGASGISRDHASKLFQSLAAIGRLQPQTKAGAAAGPPNLPPALVAEVLSALQDLASEIKLQETFDGIKVELGNLVFAVDKVNFGSGATSEKGMLRSNVELGYSGLRIPDIGMGGVEGLIPTVVSLNPSISGVATADLIRVLTALNNKHDPSAADMAALFSHGGVIAGLDRLSINVAGATFTGQGKLTATSPSVMAGTAQLVAENYDAMVQKVSTFPMAAQAMPVMIFLKGIGRTDGGKLIWDISYLDGKALINNIDVGAMLGGGQGATPQAAPTRPAPGQPRGGPAQRSPAPSTQGQSGVAPTGPTVTGRVIPGPAVKGPPAGSSTDDDDDDDDAVAVPTTPAPGNLKATPRGIPSR